MLSKFDKLYESVFKEEVEEDEVFNVKDMPSEYEKVDVKIDEHSGRPGCTLKFEDGATLFVPEAEYKDLLGGGWPENRKEVDDLLGVSEEYVNKAKWWVGKPMPSHFKKADVSSHYGGCIIKFEGGVDLFLQGDDCESLMGSCWPPNCQDYDDIEGIYDEYYDLAKEEDKRLKEIKAKKK